MQTRPGANYFLADQSTVQNSLLIPVAPVQNTPDNRSKCSQPNSLGPLL